MVQLRPALFRAMAAVKGTARLLALAGQAKPSPQIGQALGPLGVNMMEFCKQFNARTEAYKETAQMRVKLVVRGAAPVPRPPRPSPMVHSGMVCVCVVRPPAPGVRGPHVQV